MPLTPGARLGSYEIVTLLGAGGMGEVYRAHDPQLGRDVALKILPPSFADDASPRPLRAQARILASLTPPDIAPILGVEETTARRRLVVELVEGEDLASASRAAPCRSTKRCAIARQIAEAIEAPTRTASSIAI